jgi:hypothetical protein
MMMMMVLTVAGDDDAGCSVSRGFLLLILPTVGYIWKKQKQNEQRAAPWSVSTSAWHQSHNKNTIMQ